MGFPKEILKTLILNICSPRLQHRIRRFYLTRQVLKKQTFHEAEIMVLKLFISAGDSVADVGANVGVYTRELSSLAGSRGRVYAFEPVSENYDILEAVVRSAHLANVLTYRNALGAQPSQREMVLPDLGGFTGYYWAHFAQPGDAGRREVVDVLTLDELWKRHIIPSLDFIKCDVEGSELGVIQGGLELTHSQYPAWLLEVSRNASGEVFDLLKDMGYRVYVYDGNLVHTENYRDREFSNYFFFHPRSKTWGRVQPYLQT